MRRLLARKANTSGSRKNKTYLTNLNEPRAMKTTRTRGLTDPPPTNTNITGIKRLRKKVQLTAGVGSLSFADIGNCLPLLVVSAEIRILKLSAWASATANSLLIVKFPVGALPSADGDNQTWTDEGTQGAMRPAIHLIPNFSFRNQWVSASNAAVVATFGGTATDLLVVDVTVEYRTDAQSCPALANHLISAMKALEVYDEVDGDTPPDDPDTSESESAGYVISYDD